MAHPYSTEARLELLIGADRVGQLLDRNRDDVDDVGLYDAAVERACNSIDARLAQRWVVPFAAITDIPASPGLISDIADHLTAAHLYARENPEAQDVEYHQGEAGKLLDGLLEGDYDIDATRVGSSTGRYLATHSAATPIFAGRDSEGVRRTRGF